MPFITASSIVFQFILPLIFLLGVWPAQITFYPAVCVFLFFIFFIFSHHNTTSNWFPDIFQTTYRTTAPLGEDIYISQTDGEVKGELVDSLGQWGITAGRAVCEGKDVLIVCPSFESIICCRSLYVFNTCVHLFITKLEKMYAIHVALHF